MKNFYFIFLKIRKTTFLLLALLAGNLVFSLSGFGQSNNSQTAIITNTSTQTSQKAELINNDSLIVKDNENNTLQSEKNNQNTTVVQDTLSTQATEGFVKLPAERVQAVRKINVAVEKNDIN